MILCIVHLAAMFPNNKATSGLLTCKENIQCEQFMVCGKLILMEGIRQDVNPEKVVLSNLCIAHLGFPLQIGISKG